MSTELIHSLVNAVSPRQEIKICELSAALLARDSHILALETQIDLLKFELKSTKTLELSHISVQTFDPRIFFESSTQFTYKPQFTVHAQSLSSYTPPQKLLEQPQLIKNIQENVKPSPKKSLSVKRLSFISAINIKADLPVKDTFLSKKFKKNSNA